MLTSFEKWDAFPSVVEHIQTVFVFRFSTVVIDRLQKVWNIIVDLSGHGMKPVTVPSGVRFTVEKARRTETWLRTDRPWEHQVLVCIAIICEDGKYRCW